MMERRIEKILKRFRDTLTKKDSDIRLVGINKKGVVRIKLKGLKKICPMVQFMMQFYLQKILKREIPGIRNIVYVIDQG